MLDPCDFTVINQDGSFAITDKIEAPEGKTMHFAVLDGPSDSVS